MNILLVRQQAGHDNKKESLKDDDKLGLFNGDIDMGIAEGVGLAFYFV